MADLVLISTLELVNGNSESNEIFVFMIEQHNLFNQVKQFGDLEEKYIFDVQGNLVKVYYLTANAIALFSGLRNSVLSL